MALQEHEPISAQERPPWMDRSSSVGSVAIFLSDGNGKLLLVQDLDEHGGKWAPIAGYIDDLLGEEPEIAAIREAKEELGLNVRLDKFLGVWAYNENGTDTTDQRPHPKQPMHVGYAYTGTILDGTFTMQKEEIQNWGFFSPSEIEKMNQEGQLKAPEYSYQGFKLWEKGLVYPLEVVQTKTRIIRFT